MLPSIPLLRNNLRLLRSVPLHYHHRPSLPLHFRFPSPPPQQRRAYLLLQTTLNPKNPPQLPTNLPAPPSTIILLTSPDSAASLTSSAITPLTNDSTATLLAATVDSLPGSKGGSRSRVNGYSWLITDRSLPIRFPAKDAKSLTFSLPTVNFTLPLANTIFQTGKETALVFLRSSSKPKVIEAAMGISDPEIEEFAHAQEDIKEAWQELGDLMKIVGARSGLVQMNPVSPDSVEIQISDDVLKENSGSGKVYSQLPLKPLTKPRKIAEGMGNILRALAKPEAACNFGASLELEEAVAKYLDKLSADKDTPEKVDVFARLTVQEPSPEVSELLLYPGARLHRVLSGGGGWGSKAGLLSLDPQGEPDVAKFEQGFEARYDGTGAEEAQHDEIVQVGQWIQFFVAENGTPVEKGLQFGAVGRVDDVHPVENDGVERTVEACFGGASEMGVDVGVAGRSRRMDVPGGAVIVDL